MTELNCNEIKKDEIEHDADFEIKKRMFGELYVTHSSSFKKVDKSSCVTTNNLYFSVNKNIYPNAQWRYPPHVVVWNYHNPQNLFDTNSHIMKRTCDTNNCCNIDHINIKNIVKTNEEIWNKIFEKGLRQNELPENWAGNTHPTKTCLIWTGKLDNRGYGQVYALKKNRSVHKLSYYINNKLESYESIGKSFVRHLCHNKKCFEPSHLILGSAKDNAGDQVKCKKSLIGETNSMATISEDTAKKIWEMKDSDLTHDQKAKMFNTTRSVVKGIITGITWNNVTGLEKKRKAYKNDSEIEWTDENIKKATIYINDRSKLSLENNKFVGTPCRIWTAGKSPDNYGRACIFGKELPAHVLSLMLKTKMSCVDICRHLCGETLCCSFDHLKEGTLEENSNDRLIHGKVKGVLSNEKIIEIRNSMSTDKRSQRERAKFYNISRTRLIDIESCNTYKHIKYDEEREEWGLAKII